MNSAPKKAHANANTSMRVEYLPLSGLRPATRNPKSH